MRLFVGIDIPEPIRKRITEYVDRLKQEVPDAQARWTRPEGWHVTLKFIGETQQTDEIRQQLLSVNQASFEIEFAGVGFFAPRSPRVFYVDISAAEGLSELAKKVDIAVVKAGIEQETGKYSPHLTLARFGSGRPQGASSDRNQPKMYTLKQLIDSRPDLRRKEFGTMTAKDFFLYQSELHPKGAQYSKIARYELS